MKDESTKLKLSVEEKYSQDECEVILRALDFAIKAHDGQKRVSGEDYVIHPILVAQILVDYDLDQSTIGAYAKLATAYITVLFRIRSSRRTLHFPLQTVFSAFSKNT